MALHIHFVNKSQNTVDYNGLNSEMPPDSLAFISFPSGFVCVINLTLIEFDGELQAVPMIYHRAFII